MRKHDADLCLDIDVYREVFRVLADTPITKSEDLPSELRQGIPLSARDYIEKRDYYLAVGARGSRVYTENDGATAVIRSGSFRDVLYRVSEAKFILVGMDSQKDSRDDATEPHVVADGAPTKREVAPPSVVCDEPQQQQLYEVDEIGRTNGPPLAACTVWLTEMVDTNSWVGGVLECPALGFMVESRMVAVSPKAYSSDQTVLWLPSKAIPVHILREHSRLGSMGSDNKPRCYWTPILGTERMRVIGDWG